MTNKDKNYVQNMITSESVPTLLRYNTLLNFVEAKLPLLTVLFFILGIISALISEPVSSAIGSGVDGFVGAYGYIAPVVIYLVLTPALTKVFTSVNGGKSFVVKMILWFAITRVMALLWAVLFTALIFDLPLVASESTSFSEAVAKALGDLGWMLTHSVYFYAIYLSLFTVLVAIKLRVVEALFTHCANTIEGGGKHLMLVIPVFMFAIGAYVASLPDTIQQQVDQAYEEQLDGGENLDSPVASSSEVTLNTVEIFGVKIADTNTPAGMIIAYIIGALLTGIACMVWHGALLGVAKARVHGFSIREYFRNYWAKVYPLLWSTSSEALSMPLNMYLVKKNYPGISDEIRGFTIGGGSFMGINGTVICVYVLGGLVTSILGIEVSVVQLLLSIPLVFLLGYGVPGIPGELVIFAGPIAIILGLPDATIPLFLSLYIGFQIGLPDSFRTGANSTDNCLNGVILQDLFDRLCAHEQTRVTSEVIVLANQQFTDVSDEVMIEDLQREPRLRQLP